MSHTKKIYGMHLGTHRVTSGLRDDMHIGTHRVTSGLRVASLDRKSGLRVTSVDRTTCTNH